MSFFWDVPSIFEAFCQWSLPIWEGIWKLTWPFYASSHARFAQVTACIFSLCSWVFGYYALSFRGLFCFLFSRFLDETVENKKNTKHVNNLIAWLLGKYKNFYIISIINIFILELRYASPTRNTWDTLSSKSIEKVIRILADHKNLKSLCGKKFLLVKMYQDIERISFLKNETWKSKFNNIFRLIKFQIYCEVFVFLFINPL